MSRIFLPLDLLLLLFLLLLLLKTPAECIVIYIYSGYIKVFINSIFYLWQLHICVSCTVITLTSYSLLSLPHTLLSPFFLPPCSFSSKSCFSCHVCVYGYSCCEIIFAMTRSSYSEDISKSCFSPSNIYSLSTSFPTIPPEP